MKRKSSDDRGRQGEKEKEKNRKKRGADGPLEPTKPEGEVQGHHSPRLLQNSKIPGVSSKMKKGLTTRKTKRRKKSRDWIKHKGQC